MKIKNRAIGPGYSPYIIAEISGNHNGSMDRAKELVKIAYESGADAVKFQTYDADSLTLDSDEPEFMISGGAWAGRRLYDLYKEVETPWAWFGELFKYAESIGITAFSTPFCTRSFELLESINAPAYKIASNELTDWPLVKLVARSGKPVIISTGTASKTDIGRTVEFMRKHGCKDLVVLHCISAYPAEAKDSNIRTMVDIRDAFGVSVGLSDHTMGTSTSVTAVALGACVIEKHFTKSRDDGGVDSHFSLEPHELSELVNDVKNSWLSLGTVKYGDQHDLASRGIFLRQLWAFQDIEPGDTFSEKNVRTARGPASVGALSPTSYEELFGRKSGRFIARNQPLLPSDLKD